jgi:uncharacterized protein with HEPN domain
MLDHGREALNLVQGIQQSEFMRDRLLQLGVVRIHEILGEAETRTPDSVKAQFPDIPWRRITGLRNRLVHAYDTVDIEIVWHILGTDLPVLVAQLDAILSQDDS